ncbi:MAG: hypothetical protein HYX53_10305 [Chloroflexi bacterium]|nr:hypothetical protein [Chloroflexota bacterium]
MMTLISRKGKALQLAALAVVLATAGFLYDQPGNSKAYSWSSGQYYLKNNGSSNYAYRTTQFIWQGWSNNLVVLAQVSFSARIPSTGWAYYGWAMMGEPSWSNNFPRIWQWSNEFERGFAMDSNNGWVSRSRPFFNDLSVPPGYSAYAYTFLCENANYCGGEVLPWSGAMVSGGFYHDATTGYQAGTSW